MICSENASKLILHLARNFSEFRIDLISLVILHESLALARGLNILRNRSITATQSRILGLAAIPRLVLHCH